MGDKLENIEGTSMVRTNNLEYWVRFCNAMGLDPDKLGRLIGVLDLRPIGESMKELRTGLKFSNFSASSPQRKVERIRHGGLRRIGHLVAAFFLL